MSEWWDEREGGMQFVNGAFISCQKILPEFKVLRDQVQRGTELLRSNNLLLGKDCLADCEWMKAFKQNASPEYIPWLKQVIPSVE
ncbi:hypothetical protein RvY_04656 [Ramazzottius varieornatus]|uniref:Uncharacterized protein n=1 Tax=Ramazzottius varieornatus TaxID=947166 RepID=A0A1D1USE3_RAMVA|nr:hypothetical protein RvY_04656 [Ramazzottius varieornatus]